MTQQRNSGIYKRFRSNNEPNANSFSQWETYSRNKQGQSSFRKRQNQQEDGQQWIGSESTPPRPDNTHEYKTNQSFEYRQGYSQSTNKSNMVHQQASKTPTQLIQDILKGFVNGGKLNQINPYYSQESEQKLTQILTSENKLELFISQLQAHMSEADSEIVKNYEMLIILLRHVSKSDVQVKHSSKGLQLNFNRNIMIKQENEIQKLQRKVKEKDEHIKQIIEQYESVIKNFYDVIEKLLEERVSGTRPNQEQNGHQQHVHPKRNYRNQSNR